LNQALTDHELRGGERNSDGEPVRLAPSRTCKHPRPFCGRFIDEAKVRGFPSGPRADHALLRGGCMAATGSPSPPSTNLTLGSGPCMAVLWRVSARRERTAGRERRLESEQQCSGSPTGGRGRSGPMRMRMRCSVQQLENGAVRIMCGPDPKTLCEVSGCDEDHMALCDYPVADGKTCDKRMCEVHRTRAGNNIDYCPDHRAAAA
jgi:hypothetical protein